jgi:small subunit ribosomal protein S16
MAVKIRLYRMGAKKRPVYRIVVADSRTPRDGRFIEIIGFYNPIAEPVELSINEEKALTWLSRGAQPTDTAKRLLEKAGVMAKFAATNNETVEDVNANQDVIEVQEV